MKITFKVNDMHCAMCAMKLEALEDKLPGVTSVAASYHKQQLVVEYDETRLTEAEIVAAVAREGYTAATAAD